ncbi:5601_t:CDS:2 [Funneliformis geosporum]|uniref:14151_t:CDS:1 n=1 Tax=Funneliformis geosporum TaxID=1117311 RepID=A0A9W4SW26_9GLOM|nr:14151_t:CDS:2 [Funneliformis geosporum]CAI2183729.1 5601_t:CDS:2 [Funneliformis geosporum]
MLDLHFDFNEALSNTARETIEPGNAFKLILQSEIKRITTDLTYPNEPSKEKNRSGNFLPDGAVLHQHRISFHKVTK